MIRLSQLTALELNNIDIARDLDQSPKLYVYSSTINGRTNKLLIQEDTSLLPQCTRSGALATFFNNTLMGTSNFYPEQGLGFANFHNLSELHEVLNKVTLPTIEYKSASLFFSQGLISDQSILGHSIRVYCKMSNDTEVNLVSIVDFTNSSNVLAKKSKLFESQIFNEALDFEFIDVEYLLNSNVPEIIEIKQLLFGNEKPTDYFIEYFAFGQESIDTFTENELQFTRVNGAVINKQSMPITFESSEMFAKVSISQNGYAISSELMHKKYDTEAYLNTLKSSEENYLVEHIFTIDCYDTNNQLISSNITKLTNPVNQFNEQLFRPIVDLETNHFTVNVTIRVANKQSGLVFRRDSELLITDDISHNFKPMPTYAFDNLHSDIVTNTVTRQITQITQSNEIPKIIQIEKKLFVQTQQLNELVLFDASFTSKLLTSTDVSGNDKLYLKIDTLVIPNESTDLLTFIIPKIAYGTKSSKYLLLDYNQNVISSGLLVK